jgi:nucleoid DNA-binding protein
MATKSKKKASKSGNTSHAQLAGLIASDVGLTKKAVGDVLAALVKHIYKGVSGGKVTVTGLGSFLIRQTKARTMKSALLGGKTVKVPAKRKPAFRPAKAFRDL